MMMASIFLMFIINLFTHQYSIIWIILFHLRFFKVRNKSLTIISKIILLFLNSAMIFIITNPFAFLHGTPNHVK